MTHDCALLSATISCDGVKNSNSFSCSTVARIVGTDARTLCEWLGVRSARKRVTREEIRENLEWSRPYGELAECEPALARFAGPRSGDYVELDWLQPPDWPWGPARETRPPRIFAAKVPHDREAEQDARDLIQLYARAAKLRQVDDTRRRAIAAVDMALRAMRRRERMVLLQRLKGKRGSSATAWSAVAEDSELESVPLAKEVFKVAVREFMVEYGRISELLANDSEFFK